MAQSPSRSAIVRSPGFARFGNLFIAVGISGVTSDHFNSRPFSYGLSMRIFAAA
jgi:hypothetical protein